MRRISTDTLRIGAIRRVDLSARDVLAIAAGNAKVSRDSLKPMPRQLARREVVPLHGIQRIDQLSTRSHKSHSATALPTLVRIVERGRRHAAPSGAHVETRGPAESAQRQGNTECPGTSVEEGKIEAVQVVVFDHVRIGDAHALQELAIETRLRRITRAACLEYFGLAGVIPDRDHEYSIAPRIETRRFQIELQTVQLVELKPLEIGATRRDEILLFGREREHGPRLRSLQLVELADGLPPSLGGPAQNRRHQRATVRGAHEMPQRARAVQLPVLKTWRGARRQIVEMRKEEPRSKALLLTDQRPGLR